MLNDIINNIKEHKLILYYLKKVSKLFLNINNIEYTKDWDWYNKNKIIFHNDIIDYKKYMICKVVCNDMKPIEIIRNNKKLYKYKLSPSLEIDKVWTKHLQKSHSYINFMKVLNLSDDSYIEHIDEDELYTGTQEENLEGLKTTCKVWRTLFNEIPPFALEVASSCLLERYSASDIFDYTSATDDDIDAEVDDDAFCLSPSKTIISKSLATKLSELLVLNSCIIHPLDIAVEANVS